MQKAENKTIKELARECETVDDVHNMLKDLFKDTLQQIFEGARVALQHCPICQKVRADTSLNKSLANKPFTQK
ncbi:MAG: hypothetical protein FH749_09765 [Firmicutes bacterium]|nr:hypothetical protein [Bacillota bacterium]